jgi:hypothetical protein
VQCAACCARARLRLRTFRRRRGPGERGQMRAIVCFLFWAGAGSIFVTVAQPPDDHYGWQRPPPPSPPPAALESPLSPVVRRWGGGSAPRVMSLRSDQVFVGAITPRICDRLGCFLDVPFSQVLRFSQERFHLGFVAGGTAQQHLQQQPSGGSTMAATLYTQVLATGTGVSGHALDMVYLGLEDGSFEGYHSETSYSRRAPGAGLPAALSWLPWTLSTLPAQLRSGGRGGQEVRAACLGRAGGGGGGSANGSCIGGAPRADGRGGLQPACCDHDIRATYTTSRRVQVGRLVTSAAVLPFGMAGAITYHERPGADRQPPLLPHHRAHRSVWRAGPRTTRACGRGTQLRSGSTSARD